MKKLIACTLIFLISLVTYGSLPVENGKKEKSPIENVIHFEFVAPAEVRSDVVFTAFEVNFRRYCESPTFNPSAYHDPRCYQANFNYLSPWSVKNKDVIWLQESQDK